MSEGFAWARKGNKAFVSGGEGNSFHVAATSWHFAQHAEAFKIAAEKVIDACEEDERRSYRDELFFPVAYLYRHCLELRMKDIITTGLHMHFFTRDEVSEAMDGHNLAKL